MRIPYFHVDAFTNRVFSGNPAGVCPLSEWLPDQVMQRIAAENNLSETAFVVREKLGWRIRWFTPTVEIDLCGHATLASAHVLFGHLNEPGSKVEFQSRSGVLSVERRDHLLVLNFPARPAVGCEPPADLIEALGVAPEWCGKARDFLVLLESEEQVSGVAPDFARLAKVDCHAVIVTAPGRDCDFVSRFFAPSVGVPEDPVTGSAHCTLIPYWAERLGKTKLRARQVSTRGGELFCELTGDRVLIGGKAVTYSAGELLI